MPAEARVHVEQTCCCQPMLSTCTRDTESEWPVSPTDKTSHHTQHGITINEQIATSAEGEHPPGKSQLMGIVACSESGSAACHMGGAPSAHDIAATPTHVCLSVRCNTDVSSLELFMEAGLACITDA